MSGLGDYEDVEAFEHLHALGYRLLVPVVPGVGIDPESPVYARRGKGPGLLGADGAWYGMAGWQQHVATADDLARWAAMGSGTGIRTGRQPDGTWLAALDADTLTPELAVSIMCEAVRTFGDLPRRVGNNPKALFPVRLSAPLPYLSLRFEDGTEGGGLVEVLGEGKHFVAAGVHPVTLRPYAWPDALVPYDALPTFAPADVEAFMRKLAATLPEAGGVVKGSFASDKDQAALRGDPALVRRAVAAIPNTSANFPSRVSWLKVGYAVRAAVEDEFEALDIWSEWSARWAEGHNDPEDVVANWGRIKPPFKVGAGYLYDLADRLGGGSFRAESQFEDVSEPDPTRDPLFTDDPSPRAASAARFVFETFDEAADKALTDPAPFLVKGILDLGAMSVVYGDSNVGKTFVVMAMEHCIATGRPYAGKKVRRGAVLHIFTEGARGGRKRAEALRRAFGPAPDFHMLFGNIDLFDPGADIGPLLNAIARMGFALSLVVVDTVARAMAGGDENLTKDMSAFVRNVDRLRVVTGAHVMLVHHCGKDAAKGARGSSALRAATDTEIEITEGKITVTKQRDLDKAWTSTFTLNVVVLGRDEDGDAITSCTVRLGAEPAAGDAEGIFAGSMAEADEARELTRLVALLKAVEGEPKATVRRLGELANIPKSTVGKMLGRLQRDRLVSSALGTWELTPKGGRYLGNAT